MSNARRSDSEETSSKARSWYVRIFPTTRRPTVDRGGAAVVAGGQVGGLAFRRRLEGRHAKVGHGWDFPAPESGRTPRREAGRLPRELHDVVDRVRQRDIRQRRSPRTQAVADGRAERGKRPRLVGQQLLVSPGRRAPVSTSAAAELWLRIGWCIERTSAKPVHEPGDPRQMLADLIPGTAVLNMSGTRPGHSPAHSAWGRTFRTGSARRSETPECKT